MPLRMAPLVLIGTVVSHWFGASVGREGTAVQMGGTLADQLTHIFRLRHAERRIVLMAGISAGFARLRHAAGRRDLRTGSAGHRPPAL
jgi:H+/Cl- antiporter ClcA